MPNHADALEDLFRQRSSYRSVCIEIFNSRNLSGEGPYKTQTLSKGSFLENKNIFNKSSKFRDAKRFSCLYKNEES